MVLDKINVLDGDQQDDSNFNCLNLMTACMSCWSPHCRNWLFYVKCDWASHIVHCDTFTIYKQYFNIGQIGNNIVSVKFLPPLDRKKPLHLSIFSGSKIKKNCAECFSKFLHEISGLEGFHCFNLCSQVFSRLQVIYNLHSTLNFNLSKTQI